MSEYFILNQHVVLDSVSLFYLQISELLYTLAFSEHFWFGPKCSGRGIVLLLRGDVAWRLGVAMESPLWTGAVNAQMKYHYFLSLKRGGLISVVVLAAPSPPTPADRKAQQLGGGGRPCRFPGVGPRGSRQETSRPYKSSPGFY